MRAEKALVKIHKIANREFAFFLFSKYSRASANLNEKSKSEVSKGNAVLLKKL